MARAAPGAVRIQRCGVAAAAAAAQFATTVPLAGVGRDVSGRTPRSARCAPSATRRALHRSALHFPATPASWPTAALSMPAAAVRVSCSSWRALAACGGADVISCERAQDGGGASIVLEQRAVRECSVATISVARELPEVELADRRDACTRERRDVAQIILGLNRYFTLPNNCKHKIAFWSRAHQRPGTLVQAPLPDESLGGGV